MKKVLVVASAKRVLDQALKDNINFAIRLVDGIRPESFSQMALDDLTDPLEQARKVFRHAEENEAEYIVFSLKRENLLAGSLAISPQGAILSERDVIRWWQEFRSCLLWVMSRNGKSFVLLQRFHPFREFRLITPDNNEVVVGPSLASVRPPHA